MIAHEESVISDSPLVVLLHGLGRTHRSMDGMRRHLQSRGFRVWSRSYPSRHRSLKELADQEVAAIEEAAGDSEVAAVTHSLGGILVRHMQGRLPWSRIVMLAPPNQGSRVAKRISYHPLFSWFFGPAGLAVAEPADWPLPTCSFAVIAGDLGPSVGNPPSWCVKALRLLPENEPHDGLVAVRETRLEGMTDFATVPASHTWIMDHPDTRELVASYLARGTFRASEE